MFIVYMFDTLLFERHLLPINFTIVNLFDFSITEKYQKKSTLIAVSFTNILLSQKQSEKKIFQ